MIPLFETDKSKISAAWKNDNILVCDFCLLDEFSHFIDTVTSGFFFGFELHVC